MDQQIDSVVREILDVEPRADLRARVLERIAEPPRRSPLRWAVVPIVAAALLMLIVAAPWRTSEQASPVIRSTPFAQAVPAVRASLPRGVKQALVDRMRTVAGTTAVAGAVRLERTEPAASISIPRLEPLDAINVAPVTVTTLNAQQVAIAPLAPIEQIEIQPVGPPEVRW